MYMLLSVTVDTDKLTVQSSLTAQHSTAQHSTAQHSTAQHSTAQHSTAQHSMCESDTSETRAQSDGYLAYETQ